MLKKLLIPVFALSLLVSCKSKNAFQYNQDIVQMENSLVPDITTTESKIEGFVNQGLFDSVGVAGEKMEEKVEAEIKKIKDKPAPDVNGGQEFKKVSIDYFEYLKSIYTSYKKYGFAASEAAREAELQHLLEIVNNKQAFMKKMNDAQVKFAEANGFKMEKK